VADARAHRAVAADRDFGARRDRQRTAVAEHDLPAAVLQRAVGPDLERAVARVGLFAVGALHGEPAVAGDRDVERAAGLANRARRGVEARARLERPDARR